MLCTDQKEAQDCEMLKINIHTELKSIKIVSYDLPYGTLKVFLHLFERIFDLSNSVFVLHLEARVGPARAQDFLNQLFRSPPKRV